ncbi:MAG: alpha/beta hydrolase [Thermodesulfobacteriota bacterium]|nr:alpha/beta hydrolase [Thermodesulfobacteriota bacterium]
MIDISDIDFSALDLPEILGFLFHPRPEFGASSSKGDWQDLLIPVETDVVVGARFHLAVNSAPTILFFHGNGEIVADYNDLGTIYKQMEVNFLPVDYRGYGRSTGRPTITAMMRDCHVIFDFVKKQLKENGCSGPLIVMGRSLGSASALEIAFHYKSEIDALIIESGFAYLAPLFRLLGVDLAALGIKEVKDFQNADKIRTFDKPTLVIHAEKDHIIPFSDGQALYEACGAKDKSFLEIPGANHNDIFLRGMSEYMAAVKDLALKLA